MENNNFENRVIYHRAKADLFARLKIMVKIAVCWFVLFRILTIWTDGVTNLDLIGDSITVALALYLPYRIGASITGTPVGGSAIAVVILFWMSTWVGDHELIAWIVIIGGYVVDFGPCFYKLLTARRQ